MERKIYPFSAIVGQENMKKALILNIINPNLGGVLIRGEKGTAKSTAVRALAQLLKKDNIQVINLPISATEDRVVGTLDIEHAIKTGEKKFEKGILYSAHKNILYVDEINLLEDHIVDVLLDSAAMGVNTIEREGISFSHPSKFVLVGTMNPEEGDLRPQLLDRFGLVVDIHGEKEIDKRVQVVKRRIKFEENPQEFIDSWKKEEEKIIAKIENAKNILKDVTYSNEILETVAKISINLGVDGHRCDLSIIKTAMTLASLDSRVQVTKDDIFQATLLAVPHRMRKTPFEDSTLSLERLEELWK
ncbi:AAA family ATPase [uncultured Cetobacterium sp.]|uniref:ATP-binding protein n=1 Tax=uncultured Cetobacterium sp. TaxID=527638 RepID=UPI002621946C|nr:AAA family ATPase [uncultured Cetobacterium sp.]